MASFDERAKDWDSDPAKVERAMVVAQAIRAALPPAPGMTALEYGCGTGLLSFALKDDFASITLADTSQGMLDVLAGKIANAGARNLQPLRLDLASQPLPAKRFDAVFSLMVLHHLPDTPTYLRQFNRLLKAGGSLYIADLEKEDGSFHGPAVQDVHQGFDRAALQQLAEAAGFQDISFSQVYTVKKLVDGHEKGFPLFLMVAHKNN